MESDGVLRVFPGDEIEWEVEIHSQSRLREVGALFVEEETESSDPLRMVLVGEVYRFEKTAERRVNFVTLRFSEKRSNQLGGTLRTDWTTWAASLRPGANWISRPRRSPRSP